MGRHRIKRGEGKRWLRRQDFRLSDEVRYIQRRAAQYDCRIVSIGPVLLFSTESGDAWMLDPVGELATAIARQGEALPVHIEDTNRNFMVAWMGNYRIDGELIAAESPPKALQLAITSRIKILAGLNIAERRIPRFVCLPGCFCSWYPWPCRSAQRCACASPPRMGDSWSECRCHEVLAPRRAA